MKILSFSSKRGATLVELIVALFIIALVILGAGMFFFYGRVNIIREAHRRAALLVASQRLEELKAADWEDIAPEAADPSFRYYLLDSSWDWLQPEVSESDPPGDARETVPVDDVADAKIVTEVQWEDDGSDGSYDYLKIMAIVNWTDSTTNTVSLSTLIAPH